MFKSSSRGMTGETVTDSGDLLIIRWSWDTAARSEWIALPWARCIAVRSGRFLLLSENTELELASGDSCNVPARQLHQLRCLNAGISLDTLRRNSLAAPSRVLEEAVM